MALRCSLSISPMCTTTVHKSAVLAAIALKCPNFLHTCLQTSSPFLPPRGHKPSMLPAPWYSRQDPLRIAAHPTPPWSLHTQHERVWGPRIETSTGPAILLRNTGWSSFSSGRLVSRSGHQPRRRRASYKSSYPRPGRQCYPWAIDHTFCSTQVLITAFKEPLLHLRTVLPSRVS
jgi:hypothetical protein